MREYGWDELLCIVVVLDEELLDLILDCIELGLDLRLFVAENGAADHAAGHTAGATKSSARRNKHVRNVLHTTIKTT